MKRTRIIFFASMVALLAAGGASAQLTGTYLGAAGIDTTNVVPPPPPIGSERAESDRAIFRATRALKGTPRWDLAVNDVDEKRIVQDMACPLGVEIKEPAQAPKLYALLMKMAPDVSRSVNGPKAAYARKRPYLVDEGEICVDKSDRLAASPDYPSGHSTWAWSVGLVLSELAPDRAPQILQRARAFGESRVVCGVHTPSAVEAGRTNGAAIVAALHGSAEFRSDLEAARTELAALRASATPPAGCDAEAALLAKPAW